MHPSSITTTREPTAPYSTPETTINGFGHAIRSLHAGTPLVTINAASFYRDPAFIAWLEHPTRRPATWHRAGTPGDYSDVFTYYGGARWLEQEFVAEGSDYPAGDDPAAEPGFSDQQYALIAAAVEAATGSSDTECLVWIRNLE